ncbi:malonate efflux carrier [Agrilactobacillus composti DSM 18527 = JCM 14202]|uniref:Malonate efflux carrier n=1 Tax=Agrilactobacillus composti DSM 18527 = JCM 14202 TaxID=1423734 RepID=X0PRP9_9LACO|nr:AEC family transporter [Agrilactobacillus composti]KRM35060.1 malonate efflux carrier [Agrilactobacillus composti DSM 18527 = JCM 14202]GAF40497.1 transport protein [Agrilactobacillus composti DSM 18527 = JCM 14202]
MIKTLIFALLPIIVTLGIGYWSAWRQIFDDHDAQRFVKLIMDFTLPMSIFAGIWGTSRKIILANVPMAAWLFGAMLGAYIILFAIYRYVAGNAAGLAALRAMSVADPSVPFVGTAILGLIFGNSLSAIDVGVSSLIINIFILPLVFGALSGEESAIKDRLISTLKKPLVIAALAGFILTLLGSHIPTELENSFTLLGKASGGVALFASGIVLATRKLRITKNVVLNVFLKNLLFPLIIWACMFALHFPQTVQRIVILTLAIPTATMPTSLAIQYQTAESEMASTQFLSTICSFFTMAGFILLIG